MAMTPELAQRVLQEIQDKMVETSRQLGMVRGQLQAREREKRVCELTVKELGSLGEGVAAYRAVGKMFIQEPLTGLVKELETRKSDSEREAKNFERAASKLERDLNETQNTWKEIMHRAQPTE
ncbi:hypothetical protein PhCBS80983_g00196 [Powellomyces hirtus]|uniref:Prefoldin subunit 1 n=1 Tax=Powellomyces hirtus TaxID=109895 RepID=A0A507EHQ3_9FUNG|nr:Prefoldin [Powellomyces hirtus]TPX62947.1 hypothetical protein PhCBS80983_g00196 [Powellomyces hirtus]